MTALPKMPDNLGSQSQEPDTETQVFMICGYIIRSVPSSVEPGPHIVRTGREKQLRFNILGTLEVWLDGERLQLAGLVRERVLSALLLEYGKSLPISRLVAAVWEDDPPDTASHQVRKAISDLRRRIPGGDAVIITDGYGYRAAVTDAQLDLAEFSSLLRQAEASSGAERYSEAIESLQSALSLWRGPILSAHASSIIEAAELSLTERKLAAFEKVTELRLRLGECAPLIPELREYIDAHPLRETLRAHLMLALCRSGRQAEALDEYAKAREFLADELGADPGPGLTSVYEMVLRQEPGSEPAKPITATEIVPDPVPVESPNTLPRDLPDFTGRQQEVNEILGYVRSADTHSAPVIAIDGMGGSGKTVLAVHAAHLMSADYPDGQIYIDLHGYTPDKKPVTADSALHFLLRLMGIPGERIPDETAGRASMWRSVLAGKRILLLADNVADFDSIGELLPTSPNCLALVTSRGRLLELDGARWIPVGPMSPADSDALVRATLGEPRVRNEPEAAEELIQLCGHLPLALRIAAGRLRNRPTWTLEYLAGRLRDESRCMKELSLGQRSIAGTISLSYETLGAKRREAFAALALHPGDRIDIHSAAALLGLGITETEDTLENLLDSHLLQQYEIDLYTFHDLVRAFARTLSGQPDPKAIESLLEYYLTVAEIACDILFAHRASRPTGIPAYSAPMPPIGDAVQARAWFTREHKVLLSAVTMAHLHGRHRHAVFLARNVSFYLDSNGYIEDFWQVCRVAVDSGRHLESPELLALPLVNLSVACWKLGKHGQAIEAALEACDIASKLGDQRIEARSEGIIARCKTFLGKFHEALVHLERGARLEQQYGAAQSQSLTAESALYAEWGRYQDAALAARRAAELARELGQARNEWLALIDQATAHAGLGTYDEAARCLLRARPLCDEATEEPGLVAVMLALSADVSHSLGHPTEAADQASRAMALAALTSSPVRRVTTLNTLGRLLIRRGEYASALELQTKAHELAENIQYVPGKARALSGMSRAAAALGHEETALTCQSTARELFASMGIHAN